MNSYLMTESPYHRIGEANCGIGTCTGDFYRSPNVSYANGDCPEIFFCSREGYERLLRHLVVESSNRIRRIAGTATALVKDESSSKLRAKSVAVTLTDGSSIEVPAAIVVGAYLFSSCYQGILSTFMERLYRCSSGRFQMDQKAGLEEQRRDRENL